VEIVKDHSLVKELMELHRQCAMGVELVRCQTFVLVTLGSVVLLALSQVLLRDHQILHVLEKLLLLPLFVEVLENVLETIPANVRVISEVINVNTG
jgi:hypothetical protein